MVDESSSPVPSPIENGSFPPIPDSGSFFPTLDYGKLAPWTDPINQDIISDTVAITRDYRGGIINALSDTDLYSELGPSRTLWALLPENKTFEEARCEMRFCSWIECFAQFDARYMVGKPGVLYLVGAKEYYNIMFTQWTTAKDDVFAFHRLKEGNRETLDEARSRIVKMKKEHRERKLQFFSYPPRAPDACIHEDDSIYEHYYGDEYTTNDLCEYDFDEEDNLGGGFQYIRDEFPIQINSTVACPRCRDAKASPKELSGPVDNTFIPVEIVDVTPDDVMITILAISQDSNPICNSNVYNGTNVEMYGESMRMVDPSAMGVGNSTAMLQRTVSTGLMYPTTYQIYFKAENEIGSCTGEVSVCSPHEGLTCSDFDYGFDATATMICKEALLW